MNYKWTVLMRIIFGLLEADVARGLNCYVCGEDGQPSCKSFGTLKEKYIKQCDPNQKGCLLRTRGNKKFRSCQETSIEDCKIANGVEYCFCTTDLCNDKPKQFDPPTDDEDLAEGSGFRVTPEENITPPISVIKVASQGFQVNLDIFCMGFLLNFLLIVF